MIRDMKPTDIPVLISLGQDMHQESRYRNLDFNPVRLMELGDQILKNPQMYLAKVYEVDNEIRGFVIAFVVHHFFGDDLTAADLAVYVMPEHRKGRVGIKLVQAYTEWCEKKGVKEPLLGVSAGIDSLRIGKLYEHMGYTDKYIVYKKPTK